MYFIIHKNICGVRTANWRIFPMRLTYSAESEILILARRLLDSTVADWPARWLHLIAYYYNTVIRT